MRISIALLILLFNTIVFAGGLETVLVPPSDSQQAGQAMIFSFYFNNYGDKSLQVNLPRSVSCKLTAAGQSVEVEAYAVHMISEGPVTICAGCFRKAQYSLTLPSTIEGAVSMEIRDFENANAMFAVQGSATPIESKSEGLPAQGVESLDSLFEIYQPYLKNISAYKPMYFLVGTDPKKSKFQFSFKYRFFDPDSPLAIKYPWTKGFHLAFTQTSFWDLKSASKPFEDTSYKPELFFMSPNIKFPWATGFFVKGGFQHESNGRGGENSRSTNFLYVKPIYIAYNEKTRLGILVAPKVWAYIANEDENNPDLKDYRGYFDLEVKFGKADSFVIGSHFRYAREGGSIELDLTYPLHRSIFKNFNLYFQVQYVNSLAESLINYKDRTEALRLGFSIVR